MKIKLYVVAMNEDRALVLAACGRGYFVRDAIRRVPKGWQVFEVNMTVMPAAHARKKP